MINGTRALARWEVLLTVILLVLVWLGARLSPVFLSAQNFANLTVAEMEIAIIAIPMTLIIIAGEIDLSVESMAGLSSAVLGFLWAAGVPLAVGIPAVLAVGVLGGLLNGILVTRAGLPSLVVTLGTLALFRGLASVVLGPRAISNFPPALQTAFVTFEAIRPAITSDISAPIKLRKSRELWTPASAMWRLRILPRRVRTDESP